MHIIFDKQRQAMHVKRNTERVRATIIAVKKVLHITNVCL